MTIILASTSKTRQAMLSNAGIRFMIARPDVDEVGIKQANPDWPPQHTARELAFRKAQATSMKHQGMLVVGADQTLSFDGKTFDKPSTHIEARQQLEILRGQSHQLISAVCCVKNGVDLWSHVDEARLAMRPFSSGFLDDYLSILGDDCLTSVGAYKIEGLGAQLFDRIDGDHFTILGLPLLPLLGFLRREGIVPT
jgi:septum formation protein